MITNLKTTTYTILTPTPKVTSQDISTLGLNSAEIKKAIIKQDKLIAKGDLSSLETMLHSQTYVLNAVFNNMVTRMANAKYVNNLEVCARIALKAQNQTRQTISTLAEVKGIKKTTFIHQLNNATNQQVNNGPGENLNETANKKVIYGHLDRGNEAEGTGKDFENQTLALQDSSRQPNMCNELIKTRPTLSKDERVGTTVGTNQ